MTCNEEEVMLTNLPALFSSLGQGGQTLCCFAAAHIPLVDIHITLRSFHLLAASLSIQTLHGCLYTRWLTSIVAQTRLSRTFRSSSPILPHPPFRRAKTPTLVATRHNVLHSDPSRFAHHLPRLSRFRLRCFHPNHVVLIAQIAQRRFNRPRIWCHLQTLPTRSLRRQDCTVRS